MKKTMLFVLSLMLLTAFAVGCSSEDTVFTDAATDAPEATMETNADTADDAAADGDVDNVDDETLSEDLDEAAGSDDTAVIETTEVPDETAED